MKKKLLALFLCCVMVFSLVPVALTTAFAAGSGLQIYGSDGALAETVQLEKSEKTELTAVAETGSGNYQWQIHVSDDVWANIVGTSGNTLELSYGLVANALDNDAAEIRCKLTNDVGNVSYSNIVTVQIQPDSVRSAAAASSAAGTVISEAQPVGEPVIVPADTPAGFSAPAPVSDPASADDPAAASDPASADDPAPVSDPPAEDTPATYNVVINYLFENNELAADPYTASLAAGSDFSATVTFPTVQGYLPYVNDEQQDSIDLSYTAIDKDYTYYVVYKPTNVDYTVIHYQQNLNDDNYTEAKRETKQGLTNSTVPDVANADKGFYALLYEKPTIAADGSTVVEVYYDRYYYLMNFNLDGGYGVEPIYARYGAPISDVGTPTKAGYSFSGWSLDGTTVGSLPETMPAENHTYKAVWKADNTAKVTVVFWGENADDEEYSYIKSAQVNVKPGTEFTYNESGALICALEEHTHSLDKCYTLTCTQEAHTHSESCYTCGITGHTHTSSCYSNVESTPTDKPGGWGNFPSNPNHGDIYREERIIDSNEVSYIYLTDAWYKITNGHIPLLTCTLKEQTHTHTDACLGCGKTEHTHSVENGCYKLTCGKTEHTHTSDCYMNGAGLDSNLWKFVKSDTVTVAADGSSVVNVYYDRTEKTLTFKYNYNKWNGYQRTETITAKWGSNISEQYKKIAANAKSTFWSVETSGEGPYTNYFGVMPQASATYYNRGKTGDEGTMTYWGQDLSGDYTVKLFEVTGVGGYTVTDEDRYEFEGFTYHHGTSNGSSCRGATFYYTRNSYTLTFNDGYEEVKKETVKYEAPLSTYNSYVPKVPSAYEPGSVTFGGWYLNPECTGVEYKLNEHKMPADNVLLYAKWVPVIHTVSFYLDQNALEAGTKLDTHRDQTVPHGSKLDPTPAEPKNGSYTFVGWFYLENGVEKAFDPANMPVTKDLQLYGKWSSNVLKEYTIYYKYKDAEGNEIEIAAPTTGSGLAGITKTFDAKGGTDLYADYQEGYFPVTKSHSLTLDIDATEENNTNVYTFWYVQKDAVPYTVKYLNKETGVPVAPEKTVEDNRKAVVTETFVPVSGMLPDAYQKRLVVSAEEGAVNEIIFYYTEDTTHAYYKITHYTENLATDAQGKPTWTEYASSQAVGDIGSTYKADPMTIPGFTYDSKVEGTVASGELTANGLELKLYYTRNSYPYQVRYLEQGTGKQLANPENGTGKYGQVISKNAIDIENYDAVDPTPQTLNIRIEEEAKLNIITFYYTEKEVTIKYQVVGPGDCGTVTPASETLKVLSGTAQGSTAIANKNFRFVGWYTDAACMQAVTSSDGTLAGTKFIPAKAEDAVWVDGTTYYAKFEYDVADLTIYKKGWEGIDEGQSFLFDVAGPNGYSKRVVINGNGSVTIKGLKIGEYTVKEVTSWSWRYTTRSSSQNITLQPAETNAVTFENTRNKEKWLGGDAYCKNTFDNKN